MVTAPAGTAHTARIPAAATLAMLALAAAPALADNTAWGPERDGWQTRLAIESPRAGYEDGDLVRLQLWLRNASGGRSAVRLRAPSGWTVGIGPDRVISIDPIQGDADLVDLAAGEARMFVGPTFRIRTAGFDALAQDNQADSQKAITLPLLPDRYSLRCPLPFWVPDENDPNRSTALRAAPAPLPLNVLSSPRSPILLPAGPYDPVTAWGQPVNGLMPALRPDGPMRLRAGDTAQFEFVVRNISTQPISFMAPTYSVYDWRPMITDAQGNDARVDSVFLTGAIALTPVTLKPGELKVLGHPTLQITPPDAKSVGIHPPALHAGAGDYHALYSLAVNMTSRGRVNLVLVTGKLAFQVLARR